MQSDALYFGLKLYELLTLIGIIVGPIVAVLISLWIDARRKDRDQKLQVFRIIMTTRHLPGDPSYSNSINLVPIEFHKNRKVIDAYNTYIEHTRFRVQADDAERHHRLLSASQTKLIFEMANELGFKLRESDLEIQAYAADGFIRRDNMVLDALAAIREVADVLKAQTRIMIGDRNVNVDLLQRRSDSEDSKEK